VFFKFFLRHVFGAHTPPHYVVVRAAKPDAGFQFANTSPYVALHLFL